MVGLKSDFTDLIKDALVVEVNLKGGSIKNGPCSLQKKLKFGPYFPIENHENKQFQKVISECLNANVINEIIDLLLNPEQEAILSMVWLPERLKISR